MEPLTAIGIDPGSLRTGWGVVRLDSEGFHLVDCGIIRTTSAGDTPFNERLGTIFRELSAVLERDRPQEAGIEAVFQAKNASSALKLGQARGVAVAACANRGIPVSDYAPSAIKQALTGTGRAEKEQVAFMVRHLLGTPRAEWPLDTSDALGVAITHLTTRRAQLRMRSQGS